MSKTPPLTADPAIPVAPLTSGQLAKLTNEELMDLAGQAFRVRCSQDAVVATVGAELDRREGWRDEGATSLKDWLVQRLGVSYATARSYTHIGKRLFDLPHIAEGLSQGTLTLDKVRAMSRMATPENDARLAQMASELSVKDLATMARADDPPDPEKDKRHHARRSVRCNDTLRTIVAQLPPASYAEVRAVLEERAKRISSDSKTPWDTRMADAFVSLIRARTPTGSSSNTLVVAHTPLEVLLDPTSPLLGELERCGLVSGDVIRRLACDATVVIAVDDADGHTMYEGRARRFPTPAQRREVARRDRHCRFPGCHNALFTNCHHLQAWAHGGRTDLPNLALLCEHHHHLIHSKAWTVKGDANGTLHFEGPTGRTMTTRPSPLWTQIAGPARAVRRRASPPGSRQSGSEPSTSTGADAGRRRAPRRTQTSKRVGGSGTGATRDVRGEDDRQRGREGTRHPGG